MAVCDLNPLRILFVAADGSVTPCVYTSLTGQAEIPRVFGGREIRIAPVTFGNVNERPLLEIWEGEEYRAFRRRFAERLHHAARFALGTAGGAPASDEAPAAPEPCRSCPKLYGL